MENITHLCLVSKGRFSLLIDPFTNSYQFNTVFLIIWLCLCQLLCNRKEVLLSVDAFFQVFYIKINTLLFPQFWEGWKCCILLIFSNNVREYYALFMELYYSGSLWQVQCLLTCCTLLYTWGAYNVNWNLTVVKESLPLLPVLQLHKSS